MKSLKQGIFIVIALVMIGVAVTLILLKKDEGGGTVISETEIFKGEITELIFEAGACQVEINKGIEGQVTVHYEGIKAKYITGDLEDGKLKIRYNPKNSFSLFGINLGSGLAKKAKITLTVPEETVFKNVTMEFGAAEVRAERIMAEELFLTVGAGEMNADYLFASKSAKITVGAGSLTADKVAFTNAELKCGVGEMELSGEIYGDSTVDCGVGEVEIALTTEEDIYRGKLDCGLGDISFGRTSVDGSGKKEFGTSSAENRMDIKCGVGEVDVHFR